MKSAPRLLLRPLCALSLLAACHDSQAGRAGTVCDEPLAPWRVELLELAFTGASALPLVPHVKNRSKLQEQVVTACFELDQPRRALGYVEQIENWRRGAGYADHAFYLARRGETADVQRYLDLARGIADGLVGDDAQDWQRDAIRARIAKTHIWLGQEEAAAPFAAVVDSEAGQIAAVQAMHVEAAAFDEHAKTLDAVLATGTFEQVRGTLEAYARLYDRFFEDAPRRTQIVERLRTSSQKLPVQVRIELWTELVESALDHGDRGQALELVEEAQQLLAGATWTAMDQVSLAARLAGLRHRAGDETRARAEAMAAKALFDAERTKITDVFRAETLLPLAEAYVAMDDRPAALLIYAQALEEAVLNPNSRPRVEDLVALCCSLALHDVEPGAGLFARIREVHSALGSPW
jgi:hypothetical protein